MAFSFDDCSPCFGGLPDPPPLCLGHAVFPPKIPSNKTARSQIQSELESQFYRLISTLKIPTLFNPQGSSFADSSVISNNPLDDTHLDNASAVGIKSIKSLKEDTISVICVELKKFLTEKNDLNSNSLTKEQIDSLVNTAKEAMNLASDLMTFGKSGDKHLRKVGGFHVASHIGVVMLASILATHPRDLKDYNQVLSLIMISVFHDAREDYRQATSHQKGNVTSKIRNFLDQHCPQFLETEKKSIINCIKALTLEGKSSKNYWVQFTQEFESLLDKDRQKSIISKIAGYDRLLTHIEKSINSLARALKPNKELFSKEDVQKICTVKASDLLFNSLDLITRGNTFQEQENQRLKLLEVSSTAYAYSFLTDKLSYLGSLLTNHGINISGVTAMLAIVKRRLDEYFICFKSPIMVCARKPSTPDLNTFAH